MTDTAPVIQVVVGLRAGRSAKLPADPTVSRLIDKPAAAGPKALTVIQSARADVRERVWRLAGASSPDAAGQVVVDLDGVLVLAHSEKQDAAATWKKTYGIIH
ncbi:hypothetical protein [Streptomyces sp. NBC_00316]|uniref:hypothetical protein n=1 Tax=Streptomyces sp. NBC_00316 TaxID=2975710 RepID=UPI002E28C802|nr:hypothetical protein [Streptomyces sp. NBC_00316]